LSYLARLKGFFTYGTSLQSIGVASAIIGRMLIKKTKKEKKTKDSETSEEESESTTGIAEDKYCPNCGAPLPLNANFCNECGSSFDK